jgi:hypothetical protein
MFILSVTLPVFGQTINTGLFSINGDIGNQIIKGSTEYNDKDLFMLMGYCMEDCQRGNPKNNCLYIWRTGVN